MGRVRIAVAGAGRIGRRHIEEIQRSQSALLAAVVDPSPDARSIATHAGVPIYSSLEELLSSDRPDGAIIATPNALHVPQALQCVAAGVPVLVEKPLGHTLADGERLVVAAEQAGAKLLVGHHRRHSPVLHKAVGIVQSGVLGPIVALMGSAVFYKPDADGYFDGPFAWRREPGGGPLMINMIHEVDNLRSLAGEIVAVQAMASNATRRFAVEDTAAINLRFASGALGTFLLSDTAASPRSWEQTSQENGDFACCSDEDAYAIMGTHGSLGIPTLRLRYYERAEDRSWFRPFVNVQVPVERADPLALQIEHFAAVIRGESEPLVSGRDGLQNLRVIDAILAAARSGTTIAVAAA